MMHKRGVALAAIAAGLHLQMGPALAQDASMLDERVTQENIATTICRPGYADTVSPPFDDMMDHKERLLTERRIGVEHGRR
ncbi:hypothetical protein [Paraburkholderia sp. LEh10]|uniref:hypothetical protein n=1 Tax=Paraburkholderia sp. LEh10 TaxID=2821353 RepID=UPI003917D77B